MKFGSWPLVYLARTHGHIGQFTALQLCMKTSLHIALWKDKINYATN